MIRQAEEKDIAAIARTYEDLLRYEAAHENHSNWVLGLYPTIEVPQRNVPLGTMVVLEEAGEICASMVLNREQAEEYKTVDWHYAANAEDVLVVHTLCVPPDKAGHGYGTQMIEYAKQCAMAQGCLAVRIDTYAHNEPAKALYQKLGFRLAGVGPSLLQGLIPEEMAYLEWKVPQKAE